MKCYQIKTQTGGIEPPTSWLTAMRSTAKLRLPRFFLLFLFLNVFNYGLNRVGVLGNAIHSFTDSAPVNHITSLSIPIPNPE